MKTRQKRIEKLAEISGKQSPAHTHNTLDTEIMDDFEPYDFNFDPNDMPAPASANGGKRPMRFRSSTGQAAGGDRKKNGGSKHKNNSRGAAPMTQEEEFAHLERSGAPPFLVKTYQLITTCDDELAEWSDGGETFTVKNPNKFAKTEIPNYFEHNNFASFSRQLNFYGFKKVPLKAIRIEERRSTQGHLRFHNENFKRGRVDLLKKITRSTKSTPNPSNQNQEIKDLQDKVASLETLIRNLTYNYETLQHEVAELREQNRASARQQYASTQPIHASTESSSSKATYPMPTLPAHSAAKPMDISNIQPAGDFGRNFTLSDLDFDGFDPSAVLDYDTTNAKPQRVGSVQLASYAAAVTNSAPSSYDLEKTTMTRMGSLTLKDESNQKAI